MDPFEILRCAAPELRLKYSLKPNVLFVVRKNFHQKENHSTSIVLYFLLKFLIHYRKFHIPLLFVIYTCCHDSLRRTAVCKTVYKITCQIEQVIVGVQNCGGATTAGRGRLIAIGWWNTPEGRSQQRRRRKPVAVRAWWKWTKRLGQVVEPRVWDQLFFETNFVGQLERLFAKDLVGERQSNAQTLPLALAQLARKLRKLRACLLVVGYPISRSFWRWSDRLLKA